MRRPTALDADQLPGDLICAVNRDVDLRVLAQIAEPEPVLPDQLQGLPSRGARAAEANGGAGSETLPEEVRVCGQDRPSRLISRARG